MSHFAHVTNGIVDNVIVIEAETLALGHWGDPSEWVQTSYNTIGGQHTIGGTALRGNYAGIGYIYDKENDVFYQPRPYDHKNVLCESWTISAPTWLWTPPIPMPTSTTNPPNFCVWDEETKAWIVIDMTPTTTFDQTTTTSSTPSV